MALTVFLRRPVPDFGALESPEPVDVPDDEAPDDDEAADRPEVEDVVPPLLDAILQGITVTRKSKTNGLTFLTNCACWLQLVMLLICINDLLKAKKW